MNHSIDESDIGVDFQDEGPWRCYGVQSEGSTIEELFDNATIYETDQDGGELNCYSLEDASQEVYTAAARVLGKFIGESDYEAQPF